MKKINLILTLIFGLSLFQSCETTELDLTVSPNQVSVDNLDPDFLFNNIQLGFRGFVSSAAGPGSLTSTLSRQFAMTSGNTYENAASPVSFNGLWSSAYSGILNDIKSLEPIAEERNMTYHLGVSKIFKAYVYITLVDLFGDVPMTEALMGNDNLNPGKTPQTEIYTAMMAELDAAIALLGEKPSLFPSQDLYYVTLDADAQAQWIKAANSIKLKALISAKKAGADIGVGDVKAAIEGLASKVISDPADDFLFQYGINRQNPGTRHPGYNRYYESSATGYMSNYFMWSLTSEKGFEDPRTKYYFYRQDTDATNEDIFTLGCVEASAPSHYGAVSSIYDSTIGMPFCTAVPDEGYWGRDHGDNGGIPPDDEKRTVFGVYPVGGLYDDGSGDGMQNEGVDGKKGGGIQPILLDFYIDFMMAEVQLTEGVAGDAKASLESGIRGSMKKVTEFLDVDGDATAAQIDTYVDFVLDAYDAASAEQKLNIVMKEFHIASYGNGLEAYNGYRRTGKPDNFQPTLVQNSGDYYNSFLYPGDHVNLNSTATQKERTERVFWDKAGLTLK